jgi:hypothetical protein
MSESGSRTAGYVLCVVLAVPLVLLGLVTLFWNGPVATVVAAAVTALAVIAAWIARRRTVPVRD